MDAKRKSEKKEASVERTKANTKAVRDRSLPVIKAD